MRSPLALGALAAAALPLALAGPADAAAKARTEATFRFGDRPSVPEALTRTSEGRWLLAGFGEPSTGDSFTGVAALTAPGRLDTTGGGAIVHDLRPGTDTPFGIDATADGGALVTGTVVVGSRLDQVGDREFDRGAYVLRVGRDGRAVPSFGTNGVTVLRTGSPYAFTAAMSARVLPDGKVLVAGSDDRGAFLARLLADGKLDPAFGTAGVARPLAQPTDVNDLRLLDAGAGRWILTGSFVASGDTIDGIDQRDVDWFAARVLADGKLDPSYSGDGVVRTGAGRERKGGDGDSLDAARLVKGRLVLVGTDDGSRFAATRFRINGKRDRGFGRRGAWRGPKAGSESAAAGIDSRGAAWLASSNGKTTAVSRMTARGRSRKGRVVVNVSRRRNEAVGAIEPRGTKRAILAIGIGGPEFSNGPIAVVSVRP